MAIKTKEPVEFYVGDSITWLKTLEDYPASQGWTLKYTFINAKNKITVKSTASSDKHLIDITSETSNKYVHGFYRWQSYVEKVTESGLERHTIGTGEVSLKPSFEQEPTFESRSKAQVIFEAVDATLAGQASKTQLKLKVGDKEIQYFSHTELINLREYYYKLYQKERRKNYPQIIKLRCGNV